jgi:hypothetical protein
VSGDDTIKAVHEYIRRGWSLVPAKQGDKRPTLKDWPHRAVGLDEVPRHFANAANISVILGARSGGLADLDLDSPEAIALADLYLPPSTAEFGRRSKPRSHRLYIAYLAVGCLIARYVSEHAAQRPGLDLPRLLWEFDHELARPAYRWLDQPAPDEPRRPRPRNLSQRDLDLTEIVAAIRNDCDWVAWNNIGMAIFAASGGSEAGRTAFDDFSARSSKYDPGVVVERWRNYRRSPPNRIGMGSLVHLARQNGWTSRQGPGAA